MLVIYIGIVVTTPFILGGYSKVLGVVHINLTDTKKIKEEIYATNISNHRSSE